MGYIFTCNPLTLALLWIWLQEKIQETSETSGFLIFFLLDRWVADSCRMCCGVPLATQVIFVLLVTAIGTSLWQRFGDVLTSPKGVLPLGEARHWDDPI